MRYMILQKNGVRFALESDLDIEEMVEQEKNLGTGLACLYALKGTIFELVWSHDDGMERDQKFQEMVDSLIQRFRMLPIGADDNDLIETMIHKENILAGNVYLARMAAKLS